MYPSEAQTLWAAVSFRQQNSNLNNSSEGHSEGQTCPLIFTERSKIHCHVKLHQNMTESFQVIGIFLSRSKVKVVWHQNLFSCRVNQSPSNIHTSCINFWSANRHTL